MYDVPAQSMTGCNSFVASIQGPAHIISNPSSTESKITFRPIFNSSL